MTQIKQYLKSKSESSKPSAIWFLGGVVALGIGAWLFLRKKSQDIVVQYMSAQDAEAANIVKDALKPQSFIVGNLDVENINKPIVLVGGKFANEEVGHLVDIGVFPDLTEADAGFGIIFVNQYRGFPIYNVVGWNAADTLKAANYLKQTGELPSATVRV